MPTTIPTTSPPTAAPLLRFTPPATSELTEMRRLRAELRADIDSAFASAGCPVRILFDLRHCRLGWPHVEFAVRTLLRNDAYIREKLARSAALIPPSPATKALCDLFLRIYTPARPFAVHLEEAPALAFLGEDRG